MFVGLIRVVLRWLVLMQVDMLIRIRIMFFCQGWVCCLSRGRCLWGVLIFIRGRLVIRSIWDILSRLLIISYCQLLVLWSKLLSICGVEIGLLPKHWGIFMDGRFQIWLLMISKDKVNIMHLQECYLQEMLSQVLKFFNRRKCWTIQLIISDLIIYKKKYKD